MHFDRGWTINSPAYKQFPWLKAAEEAYDSFQNPPSSLPTGKVTGLRHRVSVERLDSHHMMWQGHIPLSAQDEERQIFVVWERGGFMTTLPLGVPLYGVLVAEHATLFHQLTSVSAVVVLTAARYHRRYHPLNGSEFYFLFHTLVLRRPRGDRYNLLHDRLTGIRLW